MVGNVVEDAFFALDVSVLLRRPPKTLPSDHSLGESRANTLDYYGIAEQTLDAGMEWDTLGTASRPLVS